MRIFEKVYQDGRLGQAADIHDVTNIIESIEDVHEILKDLVERFNSGWVGFKVQSMSSLSRNGLDSFIVISFERGNEWKYIKMRMDVKSSPSV